jgi:helicase MOV-10
MVELVLQILMHHEDAHILLTAPSNPAADTLALRLAPFLDNKSLLRLQSSTRTFAETPNEVLTYSCIKNNSFVGECSIKQIHLETLTE